MAAPLRWPADFQPSDGIKRFFVGVRLLGPNLSFFRALRESQAARDRSSLQAWGADPQRRKLSRVFGAFLNRRVGWPSRYFIPEDSFATCLYGPSFDWLNDDTWAELQEMLLVRFEIAMSDSELERLSQGTLGEVVDHFVRKRSGINS